MSLDQSSHLSTLLNSFWEELAYLTADGLEKSAAEAQREQVHNVWEVKNMQRGDIIVASAEPSPKDSGFTRRLVDWTFQRASPYMQGKFTHAGIYAGNGKTIEAYPQGVIKRNASELLKGRSYVVIRPKVSARQRSAAADFAESQIGRPYNFKDFAVTASRVVLPASAAKLVGGSYGMPDKKNQSGYQCGGLVATSYAAANVRLAPQTNSRFVPPAELITGAKSTIIGRKLLKGHRLDVPASGLVREKWLKAMSRFEKRLRSKKNG